MRLALVHEHLAQDGGAEKVLQVMQGMYPDAPTYTLLYNRQRANTAFSGKDIRTSFLQQMPWAINRYKWYLPLMPLAVERYDLMSYDVVLSSASAFAKGVLTRPDATHICYCHSPTRYLWNDTKEYVDALPYARLVKRVIERYLSQLRIWDRVAADRVDFFIANSIAVQQRIQKYYRRESTVIYPPVATHLLAPAAHPENFFLTGGRLVAYKHFDITILAFNRLGLPLKIFGVGPEEQRLRALAKPNIEFLGKISDLDLRRLYSQALAFIHPQEEDFGITAVESMAAGRPVIAFGKGGAKETVKPGVSGVLFDEQAWEPLADAVIRFRSEEFDPSVVRAWAERFGEERFIRELRAFVLAHSTRTSTQVE